MVSWRTLSTNGTNSFFVRRLVNMPSTSDIYDVVIVGGGLSGLSAAYFILKKDPNLRLLVLEAKNRVGGRTCTTDLKCQSGSAKFDLGGQWVGQSQPHILSLLEEFDIEIYKQYMDGDKVMQLGKDGATSKYSGFLPSLPWGGIYHLARTLYSTDKMCKSICVEDPYSCDKAREWDSMTVDDMRRQITNHEGATDCMNAALRISFGSESSQVSLLYYLMYGHAAGGFEPLYQATEGGGQEYRIQGGALQISETLRTKIGKDKVILESPVISIDQTGDNVLVLTKDNKKYRGKRVILAIPPQFAANIEYKPRLPADRLTFLTHMPMAHLSKFIVTYQTCFWRRSGYSGEIVSNGIWSEQNAQATGVQFGPVGVVFDATDHCGNPALVGFYSGHQGIEWSKYPVEKRKDAVLKHLAECLGEEALYPIEVAEKLWNEEPYSGGCPISCPAPGYMQYFNTALREPLDRLHWAGTESATVWCGFMNGAVQSGQRAAYEVLYKLRANLINVDEYNLTYYAMRERNEKRRQEGKSREYRVNNLCWKVGLVGLVLAGAGWMCLRWRR